MSGATSSWINKQQAEQPDWVRVAMTQRKPEPNGTFLIRTKRGQARVHVGHMVIQRGDDIYCCHPGEARALMAELDDAARGVAHLTGLQPGKADKSAQADVAPRDDDTDEISRRIQTMPARELQAARASVPEVARVIGPVDFNVLVTAARRPAAPTARRAYSPPVGMPPSIEMRHPSELRIDDSYQRSIDTGPSRALIERIARGWDWRMCLPLVVSKRADGFYVIDGQHRHAAALLRGDIPFLPCCVAVYRDVAEEAAMFVAMNRARRAINRLDDFHAAQAGGNEEALAINGLIEAAGFTVSRRTGSAAWSPGEIAFTSAIAKVRRRHGDAIVQEALNLMFDAFEGQRLIAGSPIFSATCAILTSRPDGFTRERLLTALKQFDMKGWASFLDQSRGGTDRTKQLKEMLLAAYDDAGRCGGMLEPLSPNSGENN